MKGKLIKNINWKYNDKSPGEDCYIGSIFIASYFWDACCPPKDKHWIIHSSFHNLKKEYQHYKTKKEAKEFIEKKIATDIIDRLFTTNPTSKE